MKMVAKKSTIKISFIAGVNYPKFSDHGDFNFVLAHHVLKHPSYTNYYWNKVIEECKYTIIDNSAAELGESIKFEDLIKAAYIVGADEIWCPDKLYDMKTTLKWTRNFIEGLTVNEKEHFVLVGLPQGKTLREWLKCYKEMLKMPELKVIALSKYSVECFCELAGTCNFAICRKVCVDYLHKHNLVKKPLHCAGANNLIADEIRHYKQYPMVRSIDSNIAFKLGVMGHKIDECTDEPTERLNHEVDKLTNQQIKDIKYNIKKIKEAR